VYVHAFNLREGSATYELIISNESNVGISCRLFGIDANAQTREFGMVAIGKQSAGKSFLSLPLETRDRRIFVEIVGDGVSLFAEALQPEAQRHGRWPRSALVLVFLTTATATGTVYFMEKPSIEGISIPAFTVPGSVTALYAIRGLASTRYAATSARGQVLATGTLSAPSGELTIRVPAKTIGHVIRLSLDARGPLGHSVRVSDVRVVATLLAQGGIVADPRPNRPIAMRAARSLGGTAPSTTEMFAVPGHVLAGKRFKVSIKYPQNDLRIAVKNRLNAVVVKEINLPPKAESVTFMAPVSPTVETYSLVASSGRGTFAATFVRPLRVYPR
jgi:hypothetical protein